MSNDAMKPRPMVPTPEFDDTRDIPGRAPDGTPERWVKAYTCAALLGEPGATELRQCIDDLAKAQRENEELRQALGGFDEQSRLNPKCSRGLHNMSAADQTDAEGRCLWCRDLVERDEWRQATGKVMEQRDRYREALEELEQSLHSLNTKAALTRIRYAFNGGSE